MINDIFSNSFEEWFAGDNDVELSQCQDKLQSNLESKTDFANDYNFEENSNTNDDDRQLFEFDQNQQLEYINNSSTANEIYMDIEYSLECEAETGNFIQKTIESNSLETQALLYDNSESYKLVDYDKNNKNKNKFDEIETNNLPNFSVFNAINENIIKVINVVGDGIAESVENNVYASNESISDNIVKVRNEQINNIDESIEVINTIQPKLQFTSYSQHPYDLTKQGKRILFPNKN